MQEEIANESRTIQQMCDALCECENLTVQDKKDLQASIDAEYKNLKAKVKKAMKPEFSDCPYCTESWAPNANPLDPCGCESI